MSQDDSAEVVEVPTQSPRDVIRAKVFAHKELKSELVTAFGAEIEVRQPSLGTMMRLQKQSDTTDPVEYAKAIVRSIATYCYVPGTNELVFNEADIELLEGLPFDDNIGIINDAVARLTGTDVESAAKNSEKTPEPTT